MPRMNYSYKYVLFLDILGWSAEINTSGYKKEDPAKIDITQKMDVPEKIAAGLNAIQRVVRNFRKNGGDSLHPFTPVVQQFSDSFIASVPFNKDATWIEARVVAFCKEVARELLKEKFLVRGGISLGPLLHTEEMIVGPALVWAYELESKVANYPRIVVDSEIARWFNITDSLGDNSNWLMSIDGDNNQFIDYLSPDPDGNGRSQKSEYITRMELARGVINDGLHSLVDQKIKAKYEWYKKYYLAVEKANPL